MSIGTYICDPSCCIAVNWHGHQGNGSGRCWHESAWRRLAWQYGESRANTIALGLDLTTQKDVAAWDRMGRRD